MKRIMAAKVIINLGMSFLFVCVYAYRIIGDIAHEWVGVSLLMLLIAHNVANYRWYKNIGKGAYSTRRITTTTVNALLSVTMATLIITGLLQSRTVLSFLKLPGGMFLRQIHTTAAYWGIPLIGVHVGLHWGMAIAGIRKMLKSNSVDPVRIIIVRILAITLVAFGIWSSFDRDMFAKLFLGFSYDYWPAERPAVLFFAEKLSIMGVYTFVTHYALKGLEWEKKKTANSRNSDNKSFATAQNTRNQRQKNWIFL